MSLEKYEAILSEDRRYGQVMYKGEKVYVNLQRVCLYSPGHCGRIPKNAPARYIHVCLFSHYNRNIHASVMSIGSDGHERGVIRDHSGKLSAMISVQCCQCVYANTGGDASVRSADEDITSSLSIAGKNGKYMITCNMRSFNTQTTWKNHQMGLPITHHFLMKVT